MALFFLVKIIFYAKSVSFWANEWIFKYSDKIMCKLRGKVTSVSVDINFGANVNFVHKIEILAEKCQIRIKNFNFLGYVNLYMC